MKILRMTLLPALLMLLAACSQAPSDQQPSRSFGCDDPWCIELIYETIDWGLPDPPCLSCGLEFIIVEELWEEVIISLPGRQQDITMQLRDQQGEVLAVATPSARGDTLELRLDELQVGQYQLIIQSPESQQVGLNIQAQSAQSPLSIMHSLANTEALKRGLVQSRHSAILMAFGDDELGQRISRGFDGLSQPDIVINRLPTDSSQLQQQALCEDCDDIVAINSEPYIIICDPEHCIKQAVFEEVVATQAISFDLSAVFVHESYRHDFDLATPRSQADIKSWARTNNEAVCLHSASLGWCGNEVPHYLKALLEPQPQGWFSLMQDLSNLISNNPDSSTPPALTVGLMSELLVPPTKNTPTRPALSPQLLTDEQDPRAWGPLAPYVNPVFLSDVRSSIIVTQAVINAQGNVAVAETLVQALIDPEIQLLQFERSGQLPVNQRTLDRLAETELAVFIDHAKDAISR